MERVRGWDLDAVARGLGEVAVEAGRLLAAVADRGCGHRAKADGSPTTDADQAAEALIVRRLAERWPGIAVVAEESAEGLDPLREDPAALYFVVDPLDGTRDFMAGLGEYSVNIALVAGSRPVAAAIAVPANGRVWAAGRRAAVAPIADELVWAPVVVRPTPEVGATALVSRRHGDPDTEACLSGLPVGERRVASSAFKFCLIASGEADVYLRCGPTMEWDVAAGDHILTCAGGIVVGPDRRPLSYGHAERGFLNGPFAALGVPELASELSLPTSCR